MFFSTSVRPFSSADCSASTPLAAGRLPSALRSKEEIGVRMPPALPLHTVRARIICGFRLVSETGSGSSSSDFTSASGASQWGNSSRSQLSPTSVSVPISARALLALPLRSVRRLCHSICDEKVLHSVSTWLAGRACTPLGSSQINSTIRAIASLPVRFSVYRIRAHGNGLPCDKSAKSWTNVM
ncbi:Uncharacterised protein [Klebsiella pneumoniae]|nr:Uncharacterised protein [Klebsiella pneumoniae]